MSWHMLPGRGFSAGVEYFAASVTECCLVGPGVCERMAFYGTGVTVGVAPVGVGWSTSWGSTFYRFVWSVPLTWRRPDKVELIAAHGYEGAIVSIAVTPSLLLQATGLHGAGVVMNAVAAALRGDDGSVDPLRRLARASGAGGGPTGDFAPDDCFALQAVVFGRSNLLSSPAVVGEVVADLVTGQSGKSLVNVLGYAAFGSWGKGLDALGATVVTGRWFFAERIREFFFGKRTVVTEITPPPARAKYDVVTSAVPAAPAPIEELQRVPRTRPTKKRSIDATRPAGGKRGRGKATKRAPTRR